MRLENKLKFCFQRVENRVIDHRKHEITVNRMEVILLKSHKALVISIRDFVESLVYETNN